MSAVATAEQAVAVTTKYVKERMAFGKPLIELQNTRFKLAECKTEAHIGRVFLDNCIERFIAGQLDPVTAAMAKYWLTELRVPHRRRVRAAARRLRLHDRVSDRAHVGRQPRRAHLRRHERDHEGSDRVVAMNALWEPVDHHMAFWKDALAGAPTKLDLPTDKPRPALQTPRRGSETFSLPRDVLDRLNGIAREEEATSFMALARGLPASSSIDTRARTTFCSRPRSAGARGRLASHFTDNLDFRSLARGRSATGRSGAHAHGELPFERLVAELFASLTRATPRCAR